MPTSAWYWLGAYAQLVWFKDNPGNFLDSVASAGTYLGCYASGPGDNAVPGNRCGLSSNLQGQGAKLAITTVPEPSTYAMLFAGLGALAFAHVGVSANPESGRAVGLDTAALDERRFSFSVRFAERRGKAEHCAWRPRSPIGPRPRSRRKQNSLAQLIAQDIQARLPA